MLGKLLIATIVLVIGLSFCVQHLNRQLAKQEFITEVQTKLLDALHTNEKVMEQLDKERQVFQQQLDEERKTLYTEMRKVLTNDKKAASWAATPIPSSVLQLRKDGARPSANKPPDK